MSHWGSRRSNFLFLLLFYSTCLCRHRYVVLLPLGPFSSFFVCIFVVVVFVCVEFPVYSQLNDIIDFTDQNYWSNISFESVELSFLFLFFKLIFVPFVDLSEKSFLYTFTGCLCTFSEL